MSKSKKPVPFRTPQQQAVTRKAVETRARRRELLALAKQQPSFERWTAADLEKIFWDVYAWARAISRQHPNAPLVDDLEGRIVAEYKRRHQDDPMRREQQHGVDRVAAWIRAETAAQEEAPRQGRHLTVVRNDDTDPAS